jgi:hypothetical protein
VIEQIEKRWCGPMVVAASGPSLTSEQADCANAGHCYIIAVNDAYRLFPRADALYACDGRWWRAHNGCPDFAGEKWTSISEHRRDQLLAAKEFRLRVVQGEKRPGFSLDPACIHYGRNSGFQAINLAILWGGNPIVLIGFDYRMGEKRHFFGQHPKGTGLQNHGDYPRWVKIITEAAGRLPQDITIINCTPGSAIQCFPMGTLKEVLDGAHISHAA